MNILNALKALADNDGMTLKAFAPIQYKSGYQVATEGVEVRTAREAYEAIKEYNGTCGVWYSNGIYYIDKSKRVNTKKEALKIGRAYKQISVLRWADMGLVYC